MDRPNSRPIPKAAASRPGRAARRIGLLATRSLYAELALDPKPGLVSFRDRGAHPDMHAGTFMRSIFALRHYFPAIAAAGAHGQPFMVLRALGVEAERRMLRATDGINTHRGAIFVLGLLAAAAGALDADRSEPTDAALRAVLIARWGQALRARTVPRAGEPSHGQLVAARYGVGGARAEAALGFPSVFDIALPPLREALARSVGEELARLHALYHLMARVDDTNLLHRGGVPGLSVVHRHARSIVAAGGVFSPDWRQRAHALHRLCVSEGLSPGGCADLLGAAWFIHTLQSSRP